MDKRNFTLREVGILGVVLTLVFAFLNTHAIGPVWDIEFLKEFAVNAFQYLLISAFVAVLVIPAFGD